VVGDELVIVARGERGVGEIARHRLSTPGRPRIVDEHYPHHPGGNGPRRPKPKARTAGEIAFLTIGPGAQAWLIAAAAVGAQRIRSKMAAAVELAALSAPGRSTPRSRSPRPRGDSTTARSPRSWTTSPPAGRNCTWSVPTRPLHPTRHRHVGRIRPMRTATSRVMTVTLDMTDAMELSEILDYLAQWLTTTSEPAVHADLARFALATATVDRLLHHAHLIIAEGGSQRLAEAVAGTGVVPLT
jgi:hypothetical protein